MSALYYTVSLSGIRCMLKTQNQLQTRVLIGSRWHGKLWQLVYNIKLSRRSLMLDSSCVSCSGFLLSVTRQTEPFHTDAGFSSSEWAAARCFLDCFTAAEFNTNRHAAAQPCTRSCLLPKSVFSQCKLNIFWTWQRLEIFLFNFCSKWKILIDCSLQTFPQIIHEIIRINI